MVTSEHRPRLYILANPLKDGLDSALERVSEFASQYCEVVGASRGVNGVRALDAGANFLAVLGGDGTLLAVTRSLGERQIPIVGVNFGKLGFLAEFSVEEFKTHLTELFDDHQLIAERMLLELTIERGGAVCFQSLAVNDVVVQAGAPFRIIHLAIRIDGIHLSTIAGDGVIVCTPMGSTAHNMSAGGPIMEGGVLGIAITPLCPHSLTHRPLIVEHEATVEVVAEQVNEGTTVMVDGQVGYGLEPGDRMRVRRYASNLQLVRNPAHPRWYGLVRKMRWGQGGS